MQVVVEEPEPEPEESSFEPPPEERKIAPMKLGLVMKKAKSLEQQIGSLQQVRVDLSDYDLNYDIIA